MTLMAEGLGLDKTQQRPSFTGWTALDMCSGLTVFPAQTATIHFKWRVRLLQGQEEKMKTAEKSERSTLDKHTYLRFRRRVEKAVSLRDSVVDFDREKLEELSEKEL